MFRINRFFCRIFRIIVRRGPISNTYCWLKHTLCSRVLACEADNKSSMERYFTISTSISFGRCSNKHIFPKSECLQDLRIVISCDKNLRSTYWNSEWSLCNCGNASKTDLRSSGWQYLRIASCRWVGRSRNDLLLAILLPVTLPVSVLKLFARRLLRETSNCWTKRLQLTPSYAFE